jgi:phosphatidate cytidylyltransferase
VLKHRIITGVLLVAGLSGLVWLDVTYATGSTLVPEGALLALFCVVLVAPLLARETCSLITASGGSPGTGVAIICSALLALSMWWSAEGSETVPATVLAATLFLAFAAAMRNRDPDGVIRSASATLLAVGYSGGLLGFWLMLRNAHDAWVVLGAILTVKMGDIGAFAVGCSIGRTRLIPWLSPKKSWEGLAGGIVAAGILGGLLALASHSLDPVDQYPVAVGALFGVLAAVVGLFGDLIASAMKRDAGVKDSGSILPGLGGIVDTLDSLLLVGPLAWWILG